MRIRLIMALSVFLSAASVQAQSLKPEVPAPLQPGINKGIVDNTVGTHYWYFMGEPGDIHLHVQYSSMGLLGNPYRSTITITLSDEAKTWATPKSLTAESKPVDCTFDGQLKKPTKVLVSVAPPPGGLVRMGGDYQLEVTGAVAFGQQSSIDPVIGMYNQMNGYTTNLGGCKFQADGTIQTTSGANGSWKLFDKDSHSYVIDIDGQTRQCLQFIPGRGLVDSGDFIVFQLLR
jgi:hypothetical protein